MAAGKDTPKEDDKQEPSTSTVRRSSKSIWPWKKETDGSASFLRAARAGNLEKVLEFLKGSTDINTCNANGLNALHLASKEGHINVVAALLQRNANVDAATKKGNTALHIASLAGKDEIVKVLVENGACVNIQSQNGFTPLYMAAQENHDPVVRFLLAHGANQSLATEDGFTPLAVALQQGHDRVVSVLLENDTRGKVRLPALHIAAKKDDAKAAALLLHTDHNPDITSKSGFTPLHIASHYGNDNIAALLIQRGADVNYVAKHQITPLHVASKWGKGNMVSLLLDKGASIESKTRDGLTPLHCAARSGHETVVDMLLEKGAPITAKTKNGLAPLHMASQGDHVDAARILLYHKAPVDDVTVDFLTALHVAAHCGHVRVAKLLLDRKADPNSRALNGFTPLHIACKKNRIKVVELLLKHGASIEATTESGLTPLHVASFMGCMNIVIYLIQHGASADVPTVRGESPLHLAARANQTDIIRILLRNGAEVDAKAREQQTALHIASRLGNTDIVGLLLQQGASVDAPTKDLYTPLHIAAKEGQEEVAGVLLDHGASVNTPTKKGFTPLHLAAKYGHMKVAKLLLQRDAPVDPKGKNAVTPLHVAAHYDHQNVALLLLDKGAQPHATAKNGYTPLHIAARKNQMDIAGTLLEYGANANAESKAGFTPLHLSAQEGHTDMATLLIEQGAQPGGAAKNGLTPLHLCAQEDRVPVGAILVKNGASIDPQTKAGYTPLHVASHFGQMNMVRFLLQHGTKVDAPTQLGYTSLHQAAQQGHTQIVNLLLENKAQPNMETNDGKTALSIAQRLGYISVVETLKIVTETRVTTNTTTTTEEKYKVVVPETMHETFMSESEDEGADDTMLGDQSYRYLTVDEMKSLGDDSLPIDVTRDEKMDVSFQSNVVGGAPIDHISPQRKKELYAHNYPADNVDVGRAPVLAGPESLNTTMNTSFCPNDESLIVNDESRAGVPDRETTQLSHSQATVTPPLTPVTYVDESKLSHSAEALNGWDQFLVSFMVDARGGAMRGCRHSGVRVIIPPRKAAMPMRITCRYLKKDKLVHAPPLMEGEALASRILEMGPAGARFLGPVIIEVPHFASLRGKEREIVILRSDNGETWREHTLEATEEAVQEVLNESFDGEELKQLEDLNTNRITRILTTDFPQYFAIVTRIRQEVHAIGPEGGMVSSTVVPQVQAVFPQGALTKKIKVGLQAQPISTDLVAKLLGNRVAVSPIVTVEPRRRKFHKPITLTIPVPQASSKGMINQYSGEAPTLRLLCSITGGTSRAQWEDVTGSTPLTFVNDCVSFTTTVSARFWLMDCTNIPEATKMATELYREAIHVPFMAKFVVFSKRHAAEEARARVFCMTDDKEDKTLETQEHFIEVAKSRDVEVLEGKSQYLEFAGNLIPVTKSGDQLAFNFYAFRENRLPFTVRVKDQNADPAGRVAFMRQPKVGRGDAPQNPICNLNLSLPDNIQPEPAPSEPDLLALEKKYAFLSISKADTIHKADLRLSDISNMLTGDWVALAKELDVSDSDINIIKSQYPGNTPQQAIVMLRLWLQLAGNKATGNTLEKALRAISRDDIVNECICNLEVVTDDLEKERAKAQLEQTELQKAQEEALLARKEASPEISYEEKDIMKEAESAEEEEDSHKILQVPTDQEEVSEIQVVPEPRTSFVHPTSQVVVELEERQEREVVEPVIIPERVESEIVETPPHEVECLLSAEAKDKVTSESDLSSDAEGRDAPESLQEVEIEPISREHISVDQILESHEYHEPADEVTHESISATETANQEEALMLEVQPPSEREFESNLKLEGQPQYIFETEAISDAALEQEVTVERDSEFSSSETELQSSHEHHEPDEEVVHERILATETVIQEEAPALEVQLPPERDSEPDLKLDQPQYISETEPIQDAALEREVTVEGDSEFSLIETELQSPHECHEPDEEVIDESISATETVIQYEAPALEVQMPPERDSESDLKLEDQPQYISETEAIPGAALEREGVTVERDSEFSLSETVLQSPHEYHEPDEEVIHESISATETVIQYEAPALKVQMPPERDSESDLKLEDQPQYISETEAITGAALEQEVVTVERDSEFSLIETELQSPHEYHEPDEEVIHESISATETVVQYEAPALEVQMPPEMDSESDLKLEDQPQYISETEAISDAALEREVTVERDSELPLGEMELQSSHEHYEPDKEVIHENILAPESVSYDEARVLDVQPPSERDLKSEIIAESQPQYITEAEPVTDVTLKQEISAYEDSEFLVSEPEAHLIPEHIEPDDEVIHESIAAIETNITHDEAPLLDVQVLPEKDSDSEYEIIEKPHSIQEAEFIPKERSHSESDYSDEDIVEERLSSEVPPSSEDMLQSDEIHLREDSVYTRTTFEPDFPISDEVYKSSSPISRERIVESEEDQLKKVSESESISSEEGEGPPTLEISLTEVSKEVSQPEEHISLELGVRTTLDDLESKIPTLQEAPRKPDIIEISKSEFEPGSDGSEPEVEEYAQDIENMSDSDIEAPVKSDVDIRFEATTGCEMLEPSHYPEDDLIFVNKSAFELEEHLYEPEEMVESRYSSEPSSYEEQQLKERETKTDSSPLTEKEYDILLESKPPKESELLFDLAITPEAIEAEDIKKSPAAFEVAVDSPLISEAVEELDISAPQVGLTQPSDQSSQMVEGMIPHPEVKPLVSATKDPTPTEKATTTGTSQAQKKFGEFREKNKFPLKEFRRIVTVAVDNSRDLKLQSDGFVYFNKRLRDNDKRRSNDGKINDSLESISGQCKEAELIENLTENSGNQAHTIASSVESPTKLAHRPTTLVIALNEAYANELKTNDSRRMTGENESQSKDVTGNKFCFEKSTSPENLETHPEASIGSSSDQALVNPKVSCGMNQPAKHMIRPVVKSAAILKAKIEKRASLNSAGKDWPSTSSFKEFVQSVPPSSAILAPKLRPPPTAEDEVFGLMAGMTEVTNQINEDVQQLRYSETPTSETVIPLKEFRLSLNQKEELEIERLPTISENAKEVDEDEHSHVIPGEMTLTSNHIRTDYPSADTGYDVSREQIAGYTAFSQTNKVCPIEVDSLKKSKWITLRSNLSKRVLSPFKRSIPVEGVVNVEPPAQASSKQFNNKPENISLTLNNELSYNDKSRLSFDVNPSWPMQMYYPFNYSRKCECCTKDFLLNDVCNEIGNLISVVEEGIKLSKYIDIDEMISSLDTLKAKVSFALEGFKSVNTVSVSSSIMSYANEKPLFQSSIDSKVTEKSKEECKTYESCFLTCSDFLPEESQEVLSLSEDAARVTLSQTETESQNDPADKKNMSNSGNEAAKENEVVQVETSLSESSHPQENESFANRTFDSRQMAAAAVKQKNKKSMQQKNKKLPLAPANLAVAIIDDVTDTEVLLDDHDTSSTSTESRDDFHGSLYVPLRNNEDFTDTEDVHVSDMKEEELILFPIEKAVVSVIPTPHFEIKICEKEILPSNEETQVDTEKGGFHLEDRDDKRSLIMPIVIDNNLSDKQWGNYESDNEVERLTDLDDMNFEENEEKEIVDDIIESMPKEDTNILLKMESHSDFITAENVGETENIRSHKTAMTLTEDEAPTDVEEWDETAGVKTEKLKPQKTEKNDQSSDTDLAKYLDESKDIHKARIKEKRRAVKGEKQRLLAVTDVGEIGETKANELKNILGSKDFQESVTDTENFEDMEAAASTDSDVAVDISKIPSPTREKFHIVEDECGVSQVNIEPLGGDKTDISVESEQVLTDLENVDISENEAKPLIIGIEGLVGETSRILTLSESFETSVKTKNKKHRKRSSVLKREEDKHSSVDEYASNRLKRKLKSRKTKTEVETKNQELSDTDILDEDGTIKQPTVDVKVESVSNTDLEEFESSGAEESEASVKGIETTPEKTGNDTDVEDIEVEEAFEARETVDDHVSKDIRSGSLPDHKQAVISVSTKPPLHAKDVEEPEIKDSLLKPDATHGTHTDVESLEVGEEIGDRDDDLVDDSKLKATSKSPLKEVDLAVLDCLLSTQEAEVEEMTYSQSATKLSDNTQLYDIPGSSLSALKSKQDIKKFLPIPPPRKGPIGVTVKRLAEAPAKQKASKESFEGENHTSSDEGEEQLTLMRDSPRWEDEEIQAENPDDVRPIKAEIKLLVKTTEVGKESIEIRSIREFVDPKADTSIKLRNATILGNTKTREEHLPNIIHADKKHPFPQKTVHKGNTPSPKFVRPPERYSSLYEEEADEFDLMAQIRDILPQTENERSFHLELPSERVVEGGSREGSEMSDQGSDEQFRKMTPEN